MAKKNFFFVLFFLALTAAGWSLFNYWPPEDSFGGFDFPIIDTHAHLYWSADENPEAAYEVAVKTNRAVNFDYFFLEPQPFTDRSKPTYDNEIFTELNHEYFLSGGGSLSPMIIQYAETEEIDEDVKREFQTKAEKILASGALGFGELLALHLSLREGHPFAAVRPSHPLFLLLADIAAANNVPIDLHMELVSEDMTTPEWITKKSEANPLVLKADLEDFKILLNHNKNAKIIWAHAGWDNTGERTVEVMRKLLEEHANLYMSLKISPESLAETRPIDTNGNLKDEWRQLFTDFSNRFVVGTDQHYSTEKLAEKKWEGIKKILEQLPVETTKKIAYENAVEIFNLSLSQSFSR